MGVVAVLHRFSFNPKFHLSSLVPMRGAYDVQTCTYTVTGFDPGAVPFPKGATHMEVQFGVLGVAFDTSIYKLHLAAPVVIDKGGAVSSFSLQPAVFPEAGLQRIAFLGVTFHQEVRGVLHVLREEANIGLAIVG